MICMNEHQFPDGEPTCPRCGCTSYTEEQFKEISLAEWECWEMSKRLRERDQKPEKPPYHYYPKVKEER